MKAYRLLAITCLFALVLAAQVALAQTTWTNVSDSEVITEVWSDDANWSAGKPGAEIAFLTNTLNSYVVNYNTTDTGFNDGTLRMSHAAPHTMTLNINAVMGANISPGRVLLSRFNARSIMNVNNGGTLNVRYAGDSNAHTYGQLLVHDGGTVNMSYQNSNQYKVMKIFIESGGLFNGEYAITAGGTMTVEEGGVYTGRNKLMGDRFLAGTAAVTNRGSYTATRDVKVASAMQHGDRDAFFSMEGGVVRIGTEGGNYGLGISHRPNGTWGGSWSGRGEFLQSGGVVTNNVLQVGYSEKVLLDYNYSGSGFLTLEDGSFWNRGHALIGGFPPTITGDSVDNPNHNFRGTVTQSGGSFRALGPVYLANGPSTGTLNLSGGTFTVSNNGNATLFVGANEGANVTLAGEGTVNLTGGHLAVDHLVANKGVDNSILNFSSGTLEIREAADVGAGTDVTVGDGVAAARLVLGDGSTSAFVDGVTINTNALLDIGGTNVIGAAAITGNVTLSEDSILAWDFNASSQDSLTVTGSVDLPDSVTVELNNNLEDGSTPASIPLLTASGGITGSTAGWPLVEINGVSYGAVIEGNTLLMMPPRGSIFIIR